MSTPCPCKECIALPMCRNKDEIMCKKLYRYVVGPHYAQKKVSLRLYLKKEPMWFKARDWTIGFSTSALPYNSTILRGR